MYRKPIMTRGFTLIEVLVALVILLFGLLGIAGLMAKGQKAAYEAYQRQQALAIANDMVERVRANGREAATYFATVPPPGGTGTGALYDSLRGGTLAPNCGAPATNCTGAELAVYDLALWEGLLLGSGERTAAGTVPVGGIIAARGCIQELANTFGACPVAPAPTNTFYTRSVRVSVAWQGQEDTGVPVAPPSACGTGLYGATDGTRRLVSLDAMMQIQCP
jgi:type IV pilus assembly protein PilV